MNLSILLRTIRSSKPPLFKNIRNSLNNLSLNKNSTVLKISQILFGVEPLVKKMHVSSTLHGGYCHCLMSNLSNCITLLSFRLNNKFLYRALSIHDRRENFYFLLGILFALVIQSVCKCFKVK